ncbi:hypothetical protein F2Q68_00030951 [Brassica cretica]|uniref:RNase H type-1 domain-containing protein n=1 Tax=Brassica cretica TaxID=69181 RepID=A0A8S9GDV4_BRACR|nr:hypothetical protein F2Q68_00030951 [Brassica cretica]
MHQYINSRWSTTLKSIAVQQNAAIRKKLRLAFALWKSRFPTSFLLLRNSSIAATARVFLCGHGCAPSPSSNPLFLAGTTTPFICAATCARLLRSSRRSPRAYNRADSVLTNRNIGNRLGLVDTIELEAGRMLIDVDTRKPLTFIRKIASPEGDEPLLRHEQPHDGYENHGHERNSRRSRSLSREQLYDGGLYERCQGAHRRYDEYKERFPGIHGRTDRKMYSASTRQSSRYAPYEKKKQQSWRIKGDIGGPSTQQSAGLMVQDAQQSSGKRIVLGSKTATDKDPNRQWTSSSMAIGPRTSQARSLRSDRARTRLGRYVATEHTHGSLSREQLYDGGLYERCQGAHRRYDEYKERFPGIHGRTDRKMYSASTRQSSRYAPYEKKKQQSWRIKGDIGGPSTQQSAGLMVQDAQQSSGKRIVLGSKTATDKDPNRQWTSSSMAIGPRTSQARSLRSDRARTRLGRYVATEHTHGSVKLGRYVETEHIAWRVIASLIVTPSRHAHDDNVTKRPRVSPRLLTFSPTEEVLPVDAQVIGALNDMEITSNRAERLHDTVMVEGDNEDDLLGEDLMDMEADIVKRGMRGTSMIHDFSRSRNPHPRIRMEECVEPLWVFKARRRSSSVEDLQSGYGWVWMDSLEKVQLMGTQNYPRRESALHSEVEALRWAMESMLQHSTCQRFETDCKDFIAMIKEPYAWLSFATELEKIETLKICFPDFKIIHIPRAQNSISNFLAKTARSFYRDLCFIGCSILV